MTIGNFDLPITAPPLTAAKEILETAKIFSKASDDIFCRTFVYEKTHRTWWTETLLVKSETLFFEN